KVANRAVHQRGCFRYVIRPELGDGIKADVIAADQVIADIPREGEVLHGERSMALLIIGLEGTAGAIGPVRQSTDALHHLSLPPVPIKASIFSAAVYGSMRRASTCAITASLSAVSERRIR